MIKKVSFDDFRRLDEAYEEVINYLYEEMTIHSGTITLKYIEFSFSHDKKNQYCAVFEIIKD